MHEMGLREPLRFPGRHQEALQERPSQLVGEDPPPVLGERGVVPYRLPGRPPHEPAQPQGVVERLHQQPFTANRVGDLQRAGALQWLRRDRRPAGTGVKLAQRRRPLGKRSVHHRADRYGCSPGTRSTSEMNLNSPSRGSSIPRIARLLSTRENHSPPPASRRLTLASSMAFFNSLLNDLSPVHYDGWC